MGLRRAISWNAALRNLHGDRQQFAPGERAALVRRDLHIKYAGQHARRRIVECPLLKDGQYDRRGIMAAAIYAARLRREVSKEAWSVCIADALKGVWQTAKLLKDGAQTRRAFIG